MTTVARRAGRWAALLLAGLLWSGAWPALAEPTAAGTGGDCHPDQLADARAEATLRIDSHAQAVVAAAGTMTVRIPVSWAYADDLLLSESSPDHQHAMRCLLRGQGAALRPDEFRPHSPQVIAESSWVKVQYDTLFQFNKGGKFQVGPWAIDVRHKLWSLSLVPPPALDGAHWDLVRIELGGLDTSQVTPRPSQARSGQLVWRTPGPSAPPGPRVTVRLVPPWQRAWVAASTSSQPWLVANAAGVTTWWLGASAVIVFAALRARRQPSGPELTGPEESSSGVLLRWGLLKGALGLLVLLLYRVVFEIDKSVKNYELRWLTVIGFLAGWALAATARPRWTMLVAVTAATLVGVLVAVVPSLFGLSPQLLAVEEPTSAGFTALAVTAVAMLWLWFAGMALWAWLPAHAGGLLRPSSSPLRLRRTGIWLAVAAALFLGWAWWAAERNWQRVSWLGDPRAPGYDAQYSAFLSRQIAAFTTEVPAWFYAHTWVLTSLAIVALLRARDLALRVPCASPARLDRLLLALFFALVVAWRPNSYAGTQWLTGLWLVLDVAVLYGLLAVGQRRAVLTQHFEGGSGNPALCESITEAGLQDIVARARRYRELIGVLRGLDQSQSADATDARHAVEKEMSHLHRWRPEGRAGGTPRSWLPSGVTVVDVALSWGPHAKWWDNARRAALLAAGFGLPGSVALAWASYAPEQMWLRQKQTFFGAPEMVWAFITWELTWAGAGLVLGAFWRLLPGHRGPARALGLVIAYALLTALGSLGNLITNQGIGNVVLGVSLMLLVLTLTGIAMDLDTFRAERRLWSSRVQLLLSIYQMRSFSAQIAYLLVQLGAVLTVLKNFMGPEVRLFK